MNKFRIFIKPVLLIFISIAKLSLNAQIAKQATWQQTVNYKIDVTLDDEHHILRGFETIEYINNSPSTLNEIYMHLYPNAYKNNETSFAKQLVENGETSFYFAKEEERGYMDSLDFFINSKTITWSFDKENNDIAKLILNTPLKPGERCLISTPFLVKIPKVFSRLGHDGQTYNMTQWYPKPAVFDINNWNAMPYLNQGEFYSEFGSFDVTINLPKEYIIAATGVLMNENEKKFRLEKGNSTGITMNTYCKTPIKSIRFFQDSIHDFAWFASKNFGILKSDVLINDKLIETYVYSTKATDLTNNNMESIKTALVYYSENAGNYPYSHASVVKSELKAGGGMEYPMITVCDILNQEVIIHEVGHNWFYGILGSNERRYPWMDESINSYFESDAIKQANENNKINKRQNFINAATDFGMEMLAINATRLRTSQSVGMPSDEFTDINYGTMVYGKGALIFKHLRAYLGDDMFKKCFNSYFDTWKYKHPLPKDMQHIFEEVSGKKLDWFFETLINSDQKIDAKITSVKAKNGIIKIVTNSSGADYVPIPIGFYKHSQLISIFWTDEKGEINLSGDFGNITNTKFVVDPLKVVFEANRKNNQYLSQKLIKRFSQPSFKFMTQPDLYLKHTMNITPFIGFNIYNGFELGAGFNNWCMPTKKLEYMIAPMIGIRTKTLSGYANFNYKITPKKHLQSIDIGINNARFAYKPFSETYNFLRSKGYVNILFKSKNARSTIKNSLNLDYTNVASRWIEKVSTTADSNQAKPYFATNKAPIDYWFANLAYQNENKRAINPYSIKLSIEHGGYKHYDTLYWKPSVEINYLKTYTKKGRGFSIRLFAGTFISNNLSKNAMFSYRVGAKNGQFDYGMAQTLAGRGANSGLWGSHITPGDDNLKLKGSFGNLSKPFLVINVSSHLPGKIPVRPYLDLCFMQDNLYNKNNGDPQKFIYTGGIAVDIIPKIFIIYFPLAQSEVIVDAQSLQNIKNFGNRICFTLIINEFEPHHFFKRYKLF